MKEPKMTYRIESEILKSLMELDHPDITEASFWAKSYELKKGDKVRVIDEAAGIDQISKVTSVDEFGNVKIKLLKRMK